MSLYKSLKRTIRKQMPHKLWGQLSRAREETKGFVKWHLWRIRYPGHKFSCPYCKARFGRFIPYENPYDITIEADVVSGQSVDAYGCPCCGSNDRERALYFYFKNDDRLLTAKQILHFAPEKNLYSFLSSSDCSEYICADLDPKNYAHFSKHTEKINITNITYTDERFDIVICNHVLEHIPDDSLAMKEIYRILKKGGVAVVMVPMATKLDKTYEDPTKLTEDERCEAFGQYDHVRIYNEKDYFERLEAVGFSVKAHVQNMYREKMEEYGINPREKIYLAFKH